MNLSVHKNITLCVAVLFVATLSFSGCSRETDSNIGADDYLLSMDEISEKTPSHISETLSNDGKNLLIAADVDLHNSTSVYRVTFTRDVENAERMANDLVVSKYENVSQVDSWEYSWGVIENDALVASFSLDDNWIANFLDAKNNLNGSYHDEDKLFEYGYITDVVPKLMDSSPEEAGIDVCAFFQEYTELKFQPYRILAADSSDSTKPGYYTIWLQALYDNIPISLKADINGRSVSAYAHISNTGIFEFNGLFLLKQSSQELLKHIVSIEYVISQLGSSFSLLSSAEQLTINQISLEYFTQSNSDGSYTLYPVWALSANTDSAAVATARQNQTFIYYAEDGTLCGVYY